MKPIFATLRQVIRYGIVGIVNNLLGYFIYLWITFFWLEPKVAVSILYPVGVATAYFGHAKYSFSYRGQGIRPLLRYVLAHFIGYGVNILMLLVFSDKLMFPHQLVQASAIIVVGGILFVMFKYFVFPNSENIKLTKP